MKQRVRFDAQHRCQLIDHVNARGVDAALERTDIGPVDACLKGESLLRIAFFVPSPTQVPGEDLPYVHTGESIVLMGIPPRSMLDIRSSALVWGPKSAPLVLTLVRAVRADPPLVWQLAARRP